MHFSSRFHKQIVKEKKTLDLDRVFKLDKKKEIILPLGTCFLDIFCTALQKKKYNILFDHKPSVLVRSLSTLLIFIIKPDIKQKN